MIVSKNGSHAWVHFKHLIVQKLLKMMIKCLKNFSITSDMPRLESQIWVDSMVGSYGLEDFWK